MSVLDQMSSLIPGIDKPHSEYCIIQPGFQQAQQVGAGDTFLSVRPFKRDTELFFRQAVNSADFLLFPQL
jgi:hypothetical protein